MATPPLPVLNLKLLSTWPARVEGDADITVTKANGIITVSRDPTIFGNVTSFANPATSYLTFYDATVGTFKNIAYDVFEQAVADDFPGQPLTKTNDTNVTLTLGGSPTTCLFTAASLTLGWTGTLSVARGGTGQATLTTKALLYGLGTTAVGSVPVGVTGQLLAGRTGDFPQFTATPGVGVTGTTTGTFSFTGITSGTAIVTAQAVAGSPTLTLPNATGTFAVSVSAPLALSATTGNLTITGAAGQVLAGATPAFTASPTLGASGTLGSLTFGNATSGLLTLQSVTGALGTVTVSLPAATDTLVGKATTDTLTNKTYDTAGTGNSFSINGVAVTANTGTGSVVRATSPTLVTPALGTPTALVLTSATGLPLTTGVTGTLAAGNGGTGLTGAAWSTASPTVTAGSGSFTTVSASTRYQQIGKTVFFAVDINISNAGSATGAVVCPLPVAADTSIAVTFGGQEWNATQVALSAVIASGTALNIYKYDGTTIIATARRLSITGVYEAA